MTRHGDKMQILIKTPLHPTEDKLKVVRCLTNIITKHSDIREMETEDGEFLIVESKEKGFLGIIREKLRKERILDTARKILSRNKRADGLTFYLNKQAAYVGRVHFVSDPTNEDFLGPIIVTITTENPDELIQWITSA